MQPIYKEQYDYWCQMAKDDEELALELSKIKDDEKEKEERFYKKLDFGTGGLRGILGAGSNRMNIYTVRLAAQGISEYIKSQGKAAAGRGVAISYDSRHFSYEFAKASASVLAANGIKAYLFDELNPTPLLSFAVRHLNTYMGIMITASHNPAEYNGFKVYGEDGAQLNLKASEEVIKIINKLDVFKDVSFLKDDELFKSPLVESIKRSVIDAFLKESLAHQLSHDVDKDNIKIVYTPFHGTGLKPVCEVLELAGYKNVFVEEKQAQPDANFSTVKSPNPEETEGFYLAIALAKKVDADIIIGTDPDADRIGVMAKNKDGEFVALTGNQTGALLTEYILSQTAKKGLITDDSYIVSTIVTSDLAEKIAECYGVTFINVLTGFKFIAETIKEKEEANNFGYLLGFEESYGYLPGAYARDKDGVTAALLICEMAAFLKQNGKSLVDELNLIYQKYGAYTEKTLSIYMEGISGMEDMKKVMLKMRENPPKNLLDEKIIAYSDYSEGVKYDFAGGEKQALSLPKSDVLKFEFENGGFFALRPSGTEPKIKLYYSVVTEKKENGEKKIAELDRFIREMIL